jgi:hypothetical protein
MNKLDELLQKLPREGFLKVSREQKVSLPSSTRIALIRKGNEAFNQKQFDMARRVFLTAGYADGLVRLGDHYLAQGNSLEALRMYWLAPCPPKANEIIAKSAEVIKKWLKET